MAVETLADRAVFIDPDDFGVPVTYQRPGQSGVSFNAIYDDPYQALDLGGEASFEATKPEITLRENDLPTGHANGDTLVVAGTTYKRVEYRPDGTGMAVIRMQEA